MSDRKHAANALIGVIRHTQRRLVVLRALDELCLCLAVAMGCLAVLPFFHVQVLSAPVLGILTAIALIAAGVRVARAVPSVMDVSRLLDARCGLADALSTALHFKDSPLGMAKLQRARAEQLIPTVDVRSAIAFRAPRSAPALAGVTGLVLLLGALRYGVEQRLTLTRPRAAAPQDALGLAVEADQQARERQDAKPERRGMPSEIEPEAMASVSGVTNGQRPPESAGLPSAQQPAAGQQATHTVKSEESASSSPRAGTESGPGSQEGSPQSPQSGGKPSSSPNSSGLMSKLRDAVSSLASKLRAGGEQPPQNGPTSPQADGKQPSGQQSGGKNSPGGENSESKEGGNDAASQDGDKQAGKGEAKGGDQSASAKPGSGMGRQDGSKDLKDAGQQAAMGKLSEIIGKRSAGVSGEMSIEPQSSPQQLRTAYSKTTAKHSAAGGDVNREEVPIALQSYVQEYFLQVHKQAALKTARAGKPEAHE